MDAGIKHKIEDDEQDDIGFSQKRKKFIVLTINISDSFNSVIEPEFCKSVLTKEEALNCFTGENRELFLQLLSNNNDKIINDKFLCQYSIEECIYTGHPYKMIAEIITNSSSSQCIYKHIICILN